MATFIRSDHERCVCGHEGDQHQDFWGRCGMNKCRCEAMEPEILGHPDTPLSMGW
jgi:hypothetical protein